MGPASIWMHREALVGIVFLLVCPEGKVPLAFGLSTAASASHHIKEEQCVRVALRMPGSTHFSPHTAQTHTAHLSRQGYRPCARGGQRPRRRRVRPIGCRSKRLQAPEPSRFVSAWEGACRRVVAGGTRLGSTGPCAARPSLRPARTHGPSEPAAAPEPAACTNLFTAAWWRQPARGTRPREPPPNGPLDRKRS